MSDPFEPEVMQSNFDQRDREDRKQTAVAFSANYHSCRRST